MRVWLLVIGQWLDDAAHSRAFLLARELRGRGHRVVLWTSAWDHHRKLWRDRRDPDVVDGVDVRFLRGCGYRRHVGIRRLIDHRLVAQDFSRRAPQASKPDAIVAAVPDHMLAAAAIDFARDRRIPVLLDVQDKWPDLMFERVRSRLFQSIVRAALWFDRRAMRRAVGGADTVVTIMPGFAHWLRHRYGRDDPRDRVIPLATASTCRAPVTRLPDEPVRVVFAGTFNRTQHPLPLIDAAAILARSGVDVRIAIAGGGVDEDAVARRCNAAPNLDFHGWLDGPAVDRLVARCDIGVIVTTAPVEVFNHKLFTYLANGLAIVSTARGDIARLIARDRIGATVPFGDARALAGAIRALAADRDELSAMRARSAAVHRRDFDRRTVYRGFADAIEALAPAASDPPRSG